MKHTMAITDSSKDTDVAMTTEDAESVTKATEGSPSTSPISSLTRGSSLKRERKDSLPMILVNSLLNRKKPQLEVKGDGKKGAASRTKSDGSDTEVGVSATSVAGGNKEEGRGSKRLSAGMKPKDEDGRAGLDDSDSVTLGREVSS